VIPSAGVAQAGFTLSSYEPESHTYQRPRRCSVSSAGDGQSASGGTVQRESERHDYTLGPGEVDVTGTFAALQGTEVISTILPF